MHRFFIPKEWIGQDKVLVKGEQAHQIFNVLRLQSKDYIIVLDNSGWEYRVEIEKASAELIQGRVISKDFCPNEPHIKVSLYQALLKADKLEFVLQKGAELGVSAFVLFLSERCVVRKPGESKITRWKKIIKEAAEQSRRALLPALHPVVFFKEACELAGNLSILLWEEEKSISLRRILKNEPFQNAQAFNIFVGPEGGFPPWEVRYAKSQGIIPVNLGRRILRAETAGLAAISALLYEKEELG